MLKRILAGVCDPLYTASVARHSAELAQRFAARITAIAVTDIERLKNLGPAAVGSATWRHEMVSDRIDKNEDAVRQSIDVLARICDRAEVACDVIKPTGAPYRELLGASRYHDLMVFGLRGLFEHGVIGDTPDELVQLIESGVQPVLAVGPEYREINRVLVAYSGSVESAKTIRNFMHLNLWPDATIKLVHFGNKRQGPVLLSQLREYFDAYERPVELEFVDAPPKQTLLPYAEDWNADLMVVGNSAKSLIRRRVFGETALHAMRESNIPLFLSQ